MLGRYGFIHMVKLQDVVVHEAFDHVEEPKAHQKASHEHLARPPEVNPMRRSPQKHQSNYNKNISGRMEQAVKQGIEFKVFQAVRWITGTCRHVVPLQNLVQHDAVEKSSQTQTQEDTSGRWETALRL